MKTGEKASIRVALGASVLAACFAVMLAGCMGSGNEGPKPDNVTPKYTKDTPPPPSKKGMPGAPSAAPPVGNTSTNPSGYIPEKK